MWIKKKREKKNHRCLLSKLSKRLHMPKNGNGGTENESADGFWIRNFFFSVASVHMYPVNPAYKSALQSGIFLNALRIWNRVDARSRFFFKQWSNEIDPSSLPWIFKLVPSARLSLLYLLDFSFKSYNARVINAIVAMITVHCNYAKRLLDVYILRLLSMSDDS